MSIVDPELRLLIDPLLLSLSLSLQLFLFAAIVCSCYLVQLFAVTARCCCVAAVEDD